MTIRNFVNEIESSLLMGEWTGMYLDNPDHGYSEFVLMKNGLVFDGYSFHLMGKEMDINLTSDERDTLRGVYNKLEEDYIITNPSEDTLTLAGRFGGIAARGKE